MTLRLGEMTGAEAQAALARRPVILLPLGSHESHGPSLPMGDYLAADLIAGRIAERAAAEGQPCLVAPVLPFGGADYFGSVPGAIALSQATLRAVLADLLGALLRHGLTRLLILNGHGGNAQAIHEATLAVRRSHNVIIPSLYLWRIAQTLLGPEASQTAGHGADPLASIAMHLHGLPAPATPSVQACCMLGLPVGGFAQVMFDSGDGRPVAIDMPLELSDIAPDGVGPGADPSRASAARGALLTDRLVLLGARLVAHLARHSDPAMQA